MQPLEGLVFFGGFGVGEGGVEVVGVDEVLDDGAGL